MRTARRARNARGGKATWVVPSPQGVRNWTATSPLGVRCRRSSASGGAARSDRGAPDGPDAQPARRHRRGDRSPPNAYGAHAAPASPRRPRAARRVGVGATSTPQPRQGRAPTPRPIPPATAWPRRTGLPRSRHRRPGRVAPAGAARRGRWRSGYRPYRPPRAPARHEIGGCRPWSARTPRRAPGRAHARGD